MNVGERIRNRRIELGMSQTDLAIKMGYKTKSSICEVEKGGDNLTQNRIAKFAEALNVSPSYLMGWDGTTDYEVRLDSDEKNLVEIFRKSDKQQKEMIKRIFDLLEEKHAGYIKLGGGDEK